MILKKWREQCKLTVYTWKVYHPMLYWDYMATYEFHFLSKRYNSVDVNVAVATDAGLITPIVSRADIKVGHLV